MTRRVTVPAEGLPPKQGGNPSQGTDHFASSPKGESAYERAAGIARWWRLCGWRVRGGVVGRASPVPE